MDYLEVVRKLAAKANSLPENSPERQLCLDKAAELMAVYHIEKAMIDFGADRIEGRLQRETPTHKVFTFEQPYAIDRRDFFCQIAKAYGCSGVYKRTRNWENGGKYEYTYDVFGFGSDIEMVEMLFTTFDLRIANLIQYANVPSNVTRQSYIKGYLAGFGVEIARKIKDAIQNRSNEIGAELVLVGRENAITDARAALYPNLVKTNSRKVSAAGWTAGSKAGKETNLPQKSTTGNSRKAIV